MYIASGLQLGPNIGVRTVAINCTNPKREIQSEFIKIQIIAMHV